jgi:hypothetical protein
MLRILIATTAVALIADRLESLSYLPEKMNVASNIEDI